MKKKGLALIAASALLVVGVVAGSLAWLTDSTQDIQNTFTTSNIDVTLTEEAGEDDKLFKMVPGYTIEKDPKATVVDGSEDCYLFVKVVKAGGDVTVGTTTYGFGDFIEYTIADGWAQLTGVTGVDNVYYKVFDSKDTDNTNAKGTAYSILKDDKVTVKGSVTKEMMDALDAAPTKRPTLTFTAYASQLYKNNTEKFTAAEAWANISNPTGAITAP